MNQKITFPELVSTISESTGFSKHISEEFLKELFSLVASKLVEGENVKIKKLGTFKVIDVDPRKSVKIGTGEEIEIPGHRKISFSPDKEIAEAINLPFAAFETIELKDSVTDEMLDSERIDLSIKNSKPNIDSIPLPLTAWDDDDDAMNETIADNVNSESKQETEDTLITDNDEPTSADKVDDLPKDEDMTDQTSDNEITNADSYYLRPTYSATDDLVHSNNENTPSYEESSTQSRNNRHGFLPGFIFGIIASVAIFSVLYFFILNPISIENNTNKEITELNNIRENKPQTISDTISNEAIKREEQSASESVIIPQTKPSDYVVYDTITLTRFLTTMAREHYGNYHLWPYIYEENSKILGHPDRIRPGTRVVIPDKSKYDIDATDKECIRKAKQKGIEIYNRYK